MSIEFLQKCIKPAPLKLSPKSLPVGSHCAMTGAMIERGYPLKSVIAKATADIGDTFRYPSDFISEQAAQLFKQQNLRGNLFVTESNLARPMISRESAMAQNRPCWHDLLIQVDAGLQMVCIVTDESKRRLWHLAPLSTTGAAWRIYFYGSPFKGANPLSRSLIINNNQLRECMREVEQLLGLGFTASQIGKGLLGAKVVQKIGIHRSVEFERNISRWRGRNEFTLAIFVTRKPPENVEIQKEKKTCEQLDLF